MQKVTNCQFYAQTCLYEGVVGWESFKTVFSKAENPEMLDLWRCADPIPPAWYGEDVESLRRVVETVYERRSRIRQLIDEFRQSTRNPFLNWKG